MKSFTIAAAASLLSGASAQYFSLMAARSASPVHLRPVSASGLNLYIGRETATYCPEVAEEANGCPKTNSTVFAGGDGTLSMGTVVPGGQQVYIDPSSGAVEYTQAHSAAKPEGAIVDGFTYSPGEQFGILGWTNGFLACPTGEAEGEYQVFGQVDGVTFGDDCLGFDALAPNATGPGAWQYA